MSCDRLLNYSVCLYLGTRFAMFYELMNQIFLKKWKNRKNICCSDGEEEWVDQVTILHMPRQQSCRDMCKFMTSFDH